MSSLSVPAIQQPSGDAHAALAHCFDQAWLAFLIVALGLVSAVRTGLRSTGHLAVVAGLATVITARRATGTS